MFSRSVATAAFLGALFLASSLSTAHADIIRGLANKCLDVKGGNSANGTPIILYACHGGDNQQWAVNTIASRGPIFGLANKCLDVKGGNSANGTPIILYDCNGRANQQWHVSGGPAAAGEGRALIVGLANKCLDVKGANSANGTPIILYACHGRANQLWRIQ